MYHFDLAQLFPNCDGAGVSLDSPTASWDGDAGCDGSGGSCGGGSFSDPCIRKES